MNVVRGLGTLVLLLFGSLVYVWPSLLTISIEHDLHECAKAVRASSVPLADKERLLDVIDDIADLLDRGAAVSILRWKLCDDAIRDMEKDGISQDDIRLIERELLKVGRESKL